MAPGAVSLQMVCCSTDAFVLEVTQWVTGLMYLDGEDFFSAGCVWTG